MIINPRSTHTAVLRGVAVCLMTALLGAVMSFLSTRRPVRAADSRASIPFSAVMVQSRFSPEGKLAWKESQEYYRFSDGSIAERATQLYPEKDRPLVGDVYDLQRNVDLLLEPITKSVITMKNTKAEQVSFLEGLWVENCPDGEEPPIEASEPGGTILGYPTTHITVHFNPGVKEEDWMAPKFRCFFLKTILSVHSSHNETVVTSLVEGEPPRSLLSAPDDYVERAPAEVEKAFALARGGAELFGARQLERLKARYAVGR